MQRIMKTAVIMSVYRHEDPRHLEAAIGSISAQIYEDWLLLVMEDGELPEALSSILERFARSDLRIRLFKSETNRGLATSLNRLIDYCMANDSVQYIARMDSDDISTPNRLLEQVAFMDGNPTVDISGGACSEFGSSFSKSLKRMPLTDEAIKGSIFRRCPFIHPTVIFRKRIFDDGLRYPERTRFSEDIGLWFELFVRGHKAANLDLVLLKFRTSDDMVYRRRGFGKAYSELMIRLKFMPRMKATSIKNVTYCLVSFFARLMPGVILKKIYKHCR